MQQTVIKHQKQLQRNGALDEFRSLAVSGKNDTVNWDGSESNKNAYRDFDDRHSDENSIIDDKTLSFQVMSHDKLSRE